MYKIHIRAGPEMGGGIYTENNYENTEVIF